MRIEELLKLSEELTGNCQDLLKRKGNDYSGHQKEDTLANIKSTESLGVPATLGVCIRLQDKLSRLASFAGGTELQVKDESVKDTILDIINYATIFYALCKESKYGKVRIKDQEYPDPPKWEVPKYGFSKTSGALSRIKSEKYDQADDAQYLMKSSSVKEDPSVEA